MTIRILRVATILAVGVALSNGSTPLHGQTGPTLVADAELGLGAWKGRLAAFGSLGLGLSGPVVGVTLSPVAALVRHGKDRDDRYVDRHVPGGDDECVDRRTGGVYPESFCLFLGSTIVWAPHAEVHVSGESLGVPLRLGVGVRGGTENPWTWSLSSMIRESSTASWRVRFLYSADAWHVGVGAVISEW